MSLINPLLWVILLIGLSIVLKNPKWKKRLKHIGFILLLIFTNSWLGYFFLHLWEYKTIEIIDIQKPYDIGIILGPFIIDTVSFSNQGRIICAETDRLNQAIELYNQKKFKKFLLSGNDIAEDTRLYLLRLGIPSDHILVEGKSSNTHENALFSMRFLAQRGDLSNRLLLITSASHMRRAKKCFDKVGLKITPFSTNHRTSCSEVWAVTLNDVIPNHKNLGKWKLLLYEWGSTIYFKMKLYI